ncbi:glycosyltransferase [Ralstonia insidiosa]|uniref:Glycosyltransferase n=1 Tax=Ralstonia insidiosa TaxID=190721 RepID=A0A848PBB1_9RALS|nr:glycosyltransferase [Ralstonia insidiosa]NMV41886.1 glycosyltransferase [Ralstonia insidiosa]
MTQIEYPLVTIVTPTFNQSKFVAETIESVLAQTYPNIEYIVLDDGSTDDTKQVLATYAERAIIESQQNLGQARTLNKGWGMARGKYLAYLSSDDLIYPHAIERLIGILEADSGVVCAFPNSDLIDVHSRVIKRNICKPFDFEDLVVRQECYIGPGAVFRRDAFEAVGGWCPKLKLAPDREFWIRLASRGRFEFCADTLAGYRMHPKSISYKDVSEVVGREYIWVLDQYFDAPGAQPLPSILARRNEAYGYAMLILARNCLRAGLLRRGLALYKDACRLHPPLSGLPVRMRLLRNVISKPVRATLARARSVLRI